MVKFKPKQVREIYERFKELFHRDLRKYMRKYLRACPLNCRYARIQNRDVVGCSGCGSVNPEQCRKTEKFASIYDKQALYQQFSEEFWNPHIMVRRYRAEAALLWVLGVWDELVEAAACGDHPVLVHLRNATANHPPAKSDDPKPTNDDSQHGDGQLRTPPVRGATS